MSTEEGAAFARNNGLLFMETSAKSYDTIEAVGAILVLP